MVESLHYKKNFPYVFCFFIQLPKEKTIKFCIFNFVFILQGFIILYLLQSFHKIQTGGPQKRPFTYRSFASVTVAAHLLVTGRPSQVLLTVKSSLLRKGGGTTEAFLWTHCITQWAPIKMVHDICGHWSFGNKNFWLYKIVCYSAYIYG